MNKVRPVSQCSPLPQDLCRHFGRITPLKKGVKAEARRYLMAIIFPLSKKFRRQGPFADKAKGSELKDIC